MSVIHRGSIRSQGLGEPSGSSVGALDSGKPQSGNLQSQNVEQNGHPRLKLAAKVGAGLLATAALGVRYAVHELASSHAETWGTLTSPNYSPQSSVKLQSIVPFKEELQGCISTYSSEAQALAQCQAAIASIEREIKNSTGGARSVDRETFFKLAKDAGLWEFIAEQRASSGNAIAVARYMPDQAEQALAQDQSIDSIALARQLAESLLGKELPAKLKFQRVADWSAHEKAIFGDLAGLSDSFNSTVTTVIQASGRTARENSLQEAGTLTHEVGHQVYGGTESELDSWTPWRAVSREATVREEAVAVLFRQLCAAQIENADDRFVLSGDTYQMIAEHLSGQRDYGLLEGAALADAALSVFKSPIEAFHHLASKDPLDPALYQVIEANRALLQQREELVKANSMLRKDLERRLRALSK